MTAADIVSVLQGIGLFLVLVGVFWLLVNFGFYLRGLIAPAAPAAPPAATGASSPPRQA
jgi:hypothetical protein